MSVQFRGRVHASVLRKNRHIPHRMLQFSSYAKPFRKHGRVFLETRRTCTVGKGLSLGCCS